MKSDHILLSLILVDLKHSFFSCHSLDDSLDNLLKFGNLFQVLKLLDLLFYKLQSQHLNSHFRIRIISKNSFQTLYQILRDFFILLFVHLEILLRSLLLLDLSLL